MTDDAMYLDFAVIADYALVDQAGKLSVLGIFQHIWVQQFPAMHPRLHLVLRLKGKRTEVGEHHVQIRLLDEQDTEILGGNGNVTFAEPPAGVTDIEAGAILVFDVPFPHAGPYRFEITVDGERKAAVPVTVSQLPAQPAGWPAGIAYATTLLPLVYARAAIFDSTLTLCTTAAILWLFEERLVIAWAAMAVGALTKGPLAIALPLLVMVPYALATGAPVRRLFSWRAAGTCALIALPWVIVVSIRIPAFPYYIVVRETLQRVATGTFHRTAPFWYYIPIVPVAAFPWIVPALARTRGWRATWLARRASHAREPLLFACWILVPLVFFTPNQSQLPQYVLPLMPAFALAAVRNLVTPPAAAGAGRGGRSYPVLAVLLGAALVALTYWLPAPLDLTPAEKAAIPPTALALGVVLFVSAACVVVGALVRRPRAVIVDYAMVVMAIPLVSGRLLAALGDDRSAAGPPPATAAPPRPGRR